MKIFDFESATSRLFSRFFRPEYSRLKVFFELKFETVDQSKKRDVLVV